MGNIPLDMLEMAFESFEDELEKIAKARWVTELANNPGLRKRMSSTGMESAGLKLYTPRWGSGSRGKNRWRFDRPTPRESGGIARMAELPRGSAARKLQMLERSPNAPSIYNR